MSPELPMRSRLLTLVSRHVGGVAVFWENLKRQFSSIDVVTVVPDKQTHFDPVSRTLHYSVYDPLQYVYWVLAAHVDVNSYEVLVANERFELEFFLWTGTARPVAFIVHTNHEHAYSLVFRHAKRVDHFFCVSETASAYLQARGIQRISAFRYSTFIEMSPAVNKRRRVVYVGRLEPDKNILETLQLFRAFKQHGYEVRMIGTGSLEPEVCAALDSHEVGINLPREAVLRELSEASFLCLNSYVEGLPIVFSEAMHFRLGVICNYLDKSVHQVIGSNYLLHSTETDLLQRMDAFVFTEPPEPRRVNNPALNEAFMAELVSISPGSRPRTPFTPGGLLDHIPLVPHRLIRSLRAWRMRHRPS